MITDEGPFGSTTRSFRDKRQKRKNFSIFEFDPSVMHPNAEFYGEFSGEVRFSIRLLVFEKMAKNMIVSCDLKSRPFWRYDALFPR